LVGKPTRKRPLGRPRHRWEDNIKMDLKEIWLVDPNGIHVAQHRHKWWALTTHTYMPFNFINPSNPLGFGYETCPQDLTNTIRRTQIKTYTHTNYKILKLRY
jgi:hypothetical protein